jgi:hypothetical protein
VNRIALSNLWYRIWRWWPRTTCDHCGLPANWPRRWRNRADGAVWCLPCKRAEPRREDRWHRTPAENGDPIALGFSYRRDQQEPTERGQT